jgi:GDSL-like Lipase/Acylhydrolase family
MHNLVRVTLLSSLVVLSCHGGSNALRAAGCSRSEAAPKDKASSASSRSPELPSNVGLTREVTAHLRAVAKAAPRNDAVFMKIGDSITSGGGPYGSFGCFSHLEQKSGHAQIDLAGRNALRATIDYFDRAEIPAHKPGDPATTSWDRDSTAARVGRGSEWPLKKEGDGPVPLENELSETNARFAVLMLGTNDIGGSPLQYGLGPLGLRQYAKNFLDMVRELEKRGVVPILTYVPPVNSTTEPYRKWFTAAYVAVMRGIATAKKVPTIDFYTEMSALGDQGYRTGDPLHPNQLTKSACIFTSEGLRFGQNVRNLRSLEVLDKVRRAVIAQEDDVDPTPPPPKGTGTPSDPVVVPGLPFATGVDPREGGPGAFADYTSCGGYAGATGSERVFRIAVTEGTPVRAIVVPPTGECDSKQGAFTKCDDSRDVSVSLFKGSLDMAHCVGSHSTMVERFLEPGTWFVVVDSFPGAKQPDSAILTVHRCHPDDTACQAH